MTTADGSLSDRDLPENSSPQDGAPVGADVAATQPPAHAADSSDHSLAQMRADVQRRLQAIVDGEQHLRQQTQELKQRLAPLLKQIDRLHKTLDLNAGPWATARGDAAEFYQQQANELRSLASGLDREAEWRYQLAAAGLLRWQQFDQTTLSPSDAWRQSLELQSASMTDALADLASRVAELTARWLPDSDLSAAASRAGTAAHEPAPDPREAAP